MCAFIIIIILQSYVLPFQLCTCIYQIHLPPLSCGIPYFYRVCDCECRPIPGYIDILCTFSNGLKVPCKLNLLVATAVCQDHYQNRSKHSVRLLVICIKCTLET